MKNNHNAEHRKKRSIKEYTLDKTYKVYVDDLCIMSYDNLYTAIYCKSVIPNSYLVK